MSEGLGVGKQHAGIWVVALDFCVTKATTKTLENNYR